MSYRFAVPTALDYFRSLVADEGTFPLLEAAASLAQDEYPDIDVAQVLAQVDRIQARLNRRVSNQEDELQRLRVLNACFFEELGFAGNVNDYYDPDNSFIHLVLRGRRGIPISLAVIWLELAQGLGLSAEGVNFPGHFLVKVNLSEPCHGQVVLDPFTGESLGREELLERIQSVATPVHHGRQRDPDDLLLTHLLPATGRDIIWRMLRNLEEIYRSQQDMPRLAAVRARIDVLREASDIE
ncbi:MAG: transglutaminase-like domain-containing protein [Alphaproteobacteria bacterium]|nr:transglutaminase-like domain-containing protein [Alphaproteobacteria bacterium]